MTLTSAALDLLHRKPGRPRLKNRRPNAERDHKAVEPEHVVKAVVMAQRTRLVGEKFAADPMASHCLGRLRLSSVAWNADPVSISQDQYLVGERYGNLCRRHAAIMGYQTGSPRSPVMDMAGGGLSCRQEPNEESILEARRAWSDAYRALLDVGREIHRGTMVAVRTYDICLDRIPFELMDVDIVGDLRVGLNTLGRLWK